MRLRTLLLLVGVVLLAALLFVAWTSTRGVDVLALAGIGRDEHLAEVEFCQRGDVLNFILGERGASAKAAFPTYLLRRPDDEAAVGRFERALRHCRVSRPWPQLLTLFVLRVEGARGTVRYLEVWPEKEHGTAWIQSAKYNSPALLRLLEELSEDKNRLRDRTWTVPPRRELARLWRENTD